MGRKGYNPPPPGHFSKPPPSPAPPPKKDVIEIRHIYNTKDDTVIPFVYLDRLEKKLQLIFDEITEIKKTINKKQS